MSLVVELLVVGLATCIIGMVLSYLVMGSAAKDFKHWRSLGLTFFITGFLVHFIAELTKLNKWYCKNGYACKR